MFTATRLCRAQNTVPKFSRINPKRGLANGKFSFTVSPVAGFNKGTRAPKEENEMELSLEEMDLEQSEYLPNREVMCSPCYNPCCNPCCPSVAISVYLCVGIAL